MLLEVKKQNSALKILSFKFISQPILCTAYTSDLTRPIFDRFHDSSKQLNNVSGFIS